MRWLEDLINKLSDMDWAWWPFLFLRPAKDEDMTDGRVFKISLFFGPIACGVLYAAFAIRGHMLRWDTVLLYLAVCSGAFLVFMRVVAATAWNSRAKRLRAERTADKA